MVRVGGCTPTLLQPITITYKMAVYALLSGQIQSPCFISTNIQYVLCGSALLPAMICLIMSTFHERVELQYMVRRHLGWLTLMCFYVFICRHLLI
jgi:hypothetical protein